MTDTKVFKSVVPFIKSISKRQLAHELVIVKTNGGFHPNGDTLSPAMVWYATPQGFHFWLELHQEYLRNKNKADIAELV